MAQISSTALTLYTNKLTFGQMKLRFSYVAVDTAKLEYYTMLLWLHENVETTFAIIAGELILLLWLLQKLAYYIILLLL